MGLSLKSLLPVAGAAAGFFLGPAGSAAVNAALGSGIGTLLAGGELKDAVKNAAIAGIGGAGVGPQAAMQSSQAALLQEGTKDALAKAAEQETLKGEVAKQGIMSYLTPGNVLIGSTLLGALEEPEMEELSEEERRQRLTGERTDYKGDPNLVSRYDYSNEPRRVNGILYAAQGGFIEGPGTGTSDSIPAMIYQNGSPVQEARLSDGEFVMTERAVAGAGGPARMYQMMKQYEAMA